MKGIEKFVGYSLGSEFVPQRKEWLFTALSAAGGLAASLFGGAKASQAAKEAEFKQKSQEARDDAWYKRRYYEDYADTAAGQNLVRRAKEYARQNWRKAAGAQAVSGGTDAATQMAKDAGNKMVGDTIANIAATDQQRKSHVDDIHQQNQRMYNQMDMNREMQRAQNITNAAQAASNAMMSIGSAVDQASAKTTSLNGGSNNSEVKTSGAETPGVTSTQVGGKTYTRAGNGTWFDEFGNPVAGKL